MPFFPFFLVCFIFFLVTEASTAKPKQEAKKDTEDTISPRLLIELKRADNTTK